MAGEGYRASADWKGGYVSSNPAHGWQIGYAADGTTTLRPLDQAQRYRLGLKLSAIGYQHMMPLDQPQSVGADNTTVTYQWSGTLREWWINSPGKLEQCFELKTKPQGHDNSARLRLHLDTDSDLRAEAYGDGLKFSNGQGTDITYTGLKVWDANGQPLIARLQPRERGMELLVDDRAAIYPITIDPSFAQQAYLKASNTGAYDAFGYAVSVTGDTLVVGAPGENSSATGVDGDQGDNPTFTAGAAYVFVRDTAGVWRQQAYL